MREKNGGKRSWLERIRDYNMGIAIWKQGFLAKVMIKTMLFPMEY